MLHHLTHHKPQIESLSALDLLTTQESLSSQANAFLLSCKVNGLSPGTLKNYRYHLAAFVKFCSGAGIPTANEITVADIIPSHIRLFLLKLQETNKGVSVGDYRKSINRFFNWLVEEGFIPKSPMQNIKPPRKEERIIKPFSPQDIDNLLLLCSGNRFLDVRNKAIILIFLDTGLRLSELAGIQLNDVNFTQETIKVMGKGAKERVVRMGKTTQKALLRYLLLRNDRLPCLWVSEERKPLTKDGIQTIIKRLCQRAGIVNVKPSPHTFRHTFGTQALLNGAGLREVQSLLGHSTLRTTLLYVATVNSEAAIKGHRRFSPVDNMKLK